MIKLPGEAREPLETENDRASRASVLSYWTICYRSCHPFQAMQLPQADPGIL